MLGSTEQLISDYYDVKMLYPGELEAAKGHLGDETGYWSDRRDAITSVITNGQLSAAEKVRTVLLGELTEPLEYRQGLRDAARRRVVEALLAETDMSEPERLQHLIHIETGSNRVIAGTVMGDTHEYAVRTISERTREQARDGLILRVDYTEGRIGQRRLFEGATPLVIDTRHLVRYVLDRSGGADNTGRGRLLTEGSGLHFRLQPDWLAWARETYDSEVSPSIPVYGVYSSEQDFIVWEAALRRGPWEMAGYPNHGPAYVLGRQAIEGYIGKHIAEGGTRLSLIQEDVGTCPGYEWVHEIEAKGEPGEDQYLVTPERAGPQVVVPGDAMDKLLRDED